MFRPRPNVCVSCVLECTAALASSGDLSTYRSRLADRLWSMSRKHPKPPRGTGSPCPSPRGCWWWGKTTDAGTQRPRLSIDTIAWSSRVQRNGAPPGLRWALPAARLQDCSIPPRWSGAPRSTLSGLPSAMPWPPRRVAICMGGCLTARPVTSALEKGRHRAAPRKPDGLHQPPPLMVSTTR